MGVKHERRRHKKVDDGDESASHADSQDSGGRQDVSEQLTLIESAMEAGGVGLNSKKKKRNLPWEALSEPEKRWRIIERVNYPFDLANAAFFVYVGFIHFADDDVMDPLAWQLAWGSAAILTMMKVAIVFRNAISFFPLFAMFELMLSLGHLYGAIRYFFWLKDQEFNCFSGSTKSVTDRSKPRHYDTGYCYNGELLLCTAWTTAYTAGSVVFLWIWSRFYKKIITERGDVLDVDITELLTQVDNIASSMYVKRTKRGGRKEAVL